MKINSISNVAVNQEITSRVKPTEGYVEIANVQSDVVNQAVHNTSTDKEKVDDELVQKSVEQANRTLKKHDRYIERNIHEVTKAVMYKLKDSETNEVIAEFPPKKVQDMIAKMWELAGLFVDEKG